MARERVGSTRICTLGPERLDDVDARIADYRRMLRDRLERLVERSGSRGSDQVHPIRVMKPEVGCDSLR